MLIDVREPKELEETGQIPTSINIPREYLFNISYTKMSFIPSISFEFK